MKQLLFLFFGAVALFPLASFAQTATFQPMQDTVSVTFANAGGQVIPDPITNISSATGLTLRWHVDSTNFPAEWLTASAFGICDNGSCYANNDSVLWNFRTFHGESYTSAPYGYEAPGNFSLSLNLPNTDSSACFYVTVTLTDPASLYSKAITFTLCNTVTSVANVNVKPDDVLLYPNPATNELNVVYNSGADVKNIAIYNIIGKMMTIYKVSGNSANLNLDNIPSGIYLVRLLNSHGQPVVTRKFTKQ